MVRGESVDLLGQSMNWGPGAPVLTSDHDSEACTIWGVHSPRIVILVPWRDGTRSTKVLEVVGARIRSMDRVTEPRQKNEKCTNSVADWLHRDCQKDVTC